MSVIDDITAAIVSNGAKIGGATGPKVQAALRNNAQDYAQALVDIADGEKSGEIKAVDVPHRAQIAFDLYAAGIQIEVTQILLSEVQNFLNAVISAAKTSINAKLPFPVL